MKKTETLLRIAGLLIMLRDELEDLELKQADKRTVNQWLKQADRKLNELTDGGKDVNKEFELVFRHLHDTLANNEYYAELVYPELLEVLKLDLTRVRFSGKLLNLTIKTCKIFYADENIVKKFDEFLRLVDENKR